MEKSKIPVSQQLKGSNILIDLENVNIKPGNFSFKLHTCDIPLVTAGLSTDLFCLLIHGQLALIPHFPRAA